MVRALACDSRGGEFNSRSFRCQVTTLDKLLTHTHVPVSQSSIIWYQSRGCDVLRLGRVTVGLSSHWPCVTDLSGFLYPPSDSSPK